MPSNYTWIKPGMRVRCIFRYHPRFDKQATVIDVLNEQRRILIAWDDGFCGDRSWSHEGSFEPLNQRKVNKLKKELEILEAKPIKRERDISRIYYLRKQCATQ